MISITKPRPKVPASQTGFVPLLILLMLLLTAIIVLVFLRVWHVQR
jgi:Tfp pilus assembly protein PilX